jgi:hypothetical protein
MDGSGEGQLRLRHGPPTHLRPIGANQGAALVRGAEHAQRTARGASPPGTDLKRAFVAAMLEWIDAGWNLREFSSRSGTFFCTRGVERRMVCITPSDLGEAKQRL